MATSKSNGKGSGGMKILWIPGRKRTDRKGIYSSTSKVSWKKLVLDDNDLLKICLGGQQKLLAAKKESSVVIGRTEWAEKAN